MRAARLALLISVSLMLAGCTAWATYPPVEGTFELNKPTLEPIPTLMAEAIRFAREHYASDHALVVNLPPDTPAEVYDKVLEVLGDGRPMTAEGEPAFHVQTVRVRALNAEVDVIYPRQSDMHELVTIRFKKKVWGQYEVDNTRLWRFEVEPPGPLYVPPPEPEAADDIEQDVADEAEPDET
ncbi:MAG: hypothetical protein JSV91_12195 [Phycisphaerales bacterium]|nr:MAG: hypothetical protein JSV91_12195 [Phycisphaerales bacterium]